MSAWSGPAWIAGVDPFRTAVAFAVLSGALSLVVPWLSALTAALAALWATSWLATRRIRGPGSAPGPALGLAGLCAAAGAVAFVTLPEPWSIARGLVLGASLLPLWWLDRVFRQPRPSTGAIA